MILCNSPASLYAKIFDNSFRVKVPAFVRLGRAGGGPPSRRWAYTSRMQRACPVPKKQSRAFPPSKIKRGCEDGLVAALPRQRGSANQRVRVPPLRGGSFRVALAASVRSRNGILNRTHITLLVGSKISALPKQGLLSLRGSRSFTEENLSND